MNTHAIEPRTLELEVQTKPHLFQGRKPTIRINPGLMIFVGPNGAGKSQVLRALKNALTPHLGGKKMRYLSAGRASPLERFIAGEQQYLIQRARGGGMKAITDTTTPANLDTVREVASRLGLDRGALQEVLDDVARARRVYRMYEPVHRSLPTPLDIAQDVQARIEEVAQTKERMMSLLKLTPWMGDRSKAEELAHDIWYRLSEAQSFLKSELALLGDVGGQSSKNANKYVRDLLWNELLKIWTAHGGKDTGNNAADFLIEASKPVLGAAVPTRSSVGQWLLRKRNLAGSEDT